MSFSFVLGTLFYLTLISRSGSGAGLDGFLGLFLTFGDVKRGKGEMDDNVYVDILVGWVN